MSGKRISTNGLIGAICCACLLMLRPSVSFANFCPADITNDGRVDGSDLMKLRAEMGRQDCSGEPCEADINGDGKVDKGDMELLKEEFNRYDCIPGREPFPEERVEMSHIDRGAEFPTGGGEVPVNPDEEPEEDVEVPVTRFKDNEDGTVTDPETGLMWTKDADPYKDTLLFHQALAYIEEMNEGEYPNFGYADWRLPTLDELRSLIDYTKIRREDKSLLPVHTLPLGHPFDNVKSMDQGWRGENTYLYKTGHSWFVSLYCRLVGHNVKSCYGYVWPVRNIKGSHLNY